MIKYKHKNGFTLIELIFYLGSFVILSLIIVLFLIQLIQAQAKLRISRQVSQETNRAMEVILWEIKRAKSVYPPTSVFSDPGQLSLETDVNAPDSEQTTYVDFYLDDSDRLCVKREGQAGMLLVSEKIKVNNLEFTQIINGDSVSIKIYLKTQYDTSPLQKASYQDNYTLYATANLRND